MSHFHLAEGWRLGEDGRLQWILHRKGGERWRDRAWCGTREGLLDVALPHRHVAAPGPVLAALRHLPDTYTPGALDALVVREAA